MSAKRLVIAGLVGLTALISASFSSCVGTNSDETFSCPSQTVFTGVEPDGGKVVGAAVSEYMARRCGTLDCHGSDSRPMRLYSQYGLRAPEETNLSGGKATTVLELKANYAAVCTLEPEETAKAVDNQGVSADQLLVVQKARGNEAHKGGAPVKEGSKGDDCITGWLRGDPPDAVATACQLALDKL